MPPPPARRRRRAAPGLALLAALAAACAAGEPGGGEAAPGAPAPSILLVTLDTTRADAVAFEPAAEVTPNLAAIAAEGTRFARAYATAPMTLPAHASLLTGLYPHAHGVHENGRSLAADHELLAERLGGAGYATAAFVSSWVLDRRFGLARGFAHYDDALPEGRQERSATATTDAALAWLRAGAGGDAAERPRFLWVHYFDPHAPYAPPEPYRSRFAADPYRGEIAYVDAELGRLVAGFRAATAGGGHRLVVVGDHGEGLGDHGEAQHGTLLYEGVMRVPLLLAGDGVPAAVVAEPVSARRVHDTVLGWAGLAAPAGLLATEVAEPVLGEAMQPYLAYGWQPQVMGVGGPWKAIRAGGVEVYDVVADPAESRDLGTAGGVARELLRAVAAYPLPAPPAEAAVDAETRQRLASLGYVASGGGAPRLRPDAPRPRDMTHLLADLDRASGLFVAERWSEAVPLLERVLASDPGNPLVTLRLAVCQSLLGRDEQAARWFARAQEIDPASPELQHYLGLHHCRRGELAAAEPFVAASVARDPSRLPALECLARVREHQGRLAEAAALLEQVAARKRAPLADLVHLGELRMAGGDTAAAIAAFERARAVAGGGFAHDLELGVLYLAARRYGEAREALDRVPAAHPDWPLVLFKRAQVSVLLGEPDAAERVRAAEAAADATTRPLIAGERLFVGLR